MRPRGHVVHHRGELGIARGVANLVRGVEEIDGAAEQVERSDCLDRFTKCSKAEAEQGLERADDGAFVMETLNVIEERK